MSEDIAGSRTPEEAALTDEIERTREELGETVEALAAKADVKARAQARAAEVTGRLRGRVRTVKDRMAVQAGGQLRAARERVPAPVRRSARQAGTGLRERRAQAAAAVGVLVLAWLAVRWLRR